MSLITCATDCVYQKEGYCVLETPTVITNKSGCQNCVYYIKVKSDNFSDFKIHSS
ncbi:uncharacterized protein BN706_00195 [Clostridium sp. CAG:557]|nr:uncharacterized protein BN706_00195 [Clostridium sp. CAG:557]